MFQWKWNYLPSLSYQVLPSCIPSSMRISGSRIKYLGHILRHPDSPESHIMSGIGTPSPYPSPVTSSSWSLHSFLLSPCHNCRTQTVLFHQHDAMVWYCQILRSPSANYRKQRTMALAYQSEISNQLRVRCCGRVVKKPNHQNKSIDAPRSRAASRCLLHLVRWRRGKHMENIKQP